MSDKPEKTETNMYQIRIMGRLEEEWSDWFEGVIFTYETDDTTTIHCPLPDQAALHSLLLRIRDLNIKLISVTQPEIKPEDKV